MKVDDCQWNQSAQWRCLPSLPPSWCPDQFCCRYAALALPPYSLSQTSVYSEQKHGKHRNNQISYFKSSINSSGSGIPVGAQQSWLSVSRNGTSEETLSSLVQRPTGQEKRLELSRVPHAQVWASFQITVMWPNSNYSLLSEWHEDDSDKWTSVWTGITIWPIVTETWALQVWS